MRIAFVTNKTTTVSMPVFEKLAECEDVELVHTFFYNTVSEGRASPLKVFARFGVRRVAVKAFETAAGLLRMQFGKRFGNHLMRAKSPYEMAVIDDLPHSTISDINQSENIELLRKLKLDVVLVCVCKNILHRKILSLPGTRFINVHPSLLPQYRGPTPTFWMLYHGERETGVTFHAMTPRIDEGKILAQLSMPLDRRQSEVEIEYQVFQLATTIVEDVLLNLDSNERQDISQPQERESSYYTFPTPKQRRELKEILRCQ